MLGPNNKRTSFGANPYRKWYGHAAEKFTAFGNFPGTPKPSAVRARLAQCPDGEPSQLSERLIDILTELRRSSLPARQRFESIKACSRAAAQLRRNLDESVAGLTLPLSADEKQLACRCVEVYWLIAECYKELAEENDSRESCHLRHSTYLLWACYWGIVNLSECLLVSYERYIQIRKGMWLDLHKFYSTALRAGLETVEIEADDGTRVYRTIENAYKRGILLGLSDPFRLPFKGLTQVILWLDECAPLTSLTTTPPDSGRCVFAVDPTLDHPAMPTLSKSRIRPEFNEKWLSTRDIVDKLKEHHKRAVDKALLRLDSERVAEDLESTELLRRLVINWGIRPIRSIGRIPVYKRCDLVISVKAVSTVLNIFESLIEKKSGLSMAWLNAIKKTFPRSISAGEDSSRIINNWDVEDESERGWRLSTGENTESGRVSVGDLVAVRTGYNWQIGSVRWAQSDSDNRLRLGIRKIKGSPWPAVIRPLETTAASSPAFSPALLLVERTGDERTLSLLCDRDMYFPTSLYLAKPVGGRGERLFQTTGIKLATRSTVWFGVDKPKVSAQQRTVTMIHPRRRAHLAFSVPE